MTSFWINLVFDIVVGFVAGYFIRTLEVRDLKHRNEKFREELFARMKSGQRR